MGKQAELIKSKKVASNAAAGHWTLEDAAARFSEVVWHARKGGPQRVTVRGHDAEVVMSAEEFNKLAPEKLHVSFVAFMESLHLDGLHLEREMNRARDVKISTL